MYIDIRYHAVVLSLLYHCYRNDAAQQHAEAARDFEVSVKRAAAAKADKDTAAAAAAAVQASKDAAAAAAALQNAEKKDDVASTAAQQARHISHRHIFVIVTYRSGPWSLASSVGRRC